MFFPPTIVKHPFAYIWHKIFGDDGAIYVGGERTWREGKCTSWIEHTRSNSFKYSDSISMECLISARQV